MPVARYDSIYRSLKKALETEMYPCQSMLPSEHQLTNLYQCSRNTVRRAILQLADEGYVQSVHGKGVVVIYQGQDQEMFSVNGAKSLREAAQREHLELSVKVVQFAEGIINGALSNQTGFMLGTAFCYLQRVYYWEGEAVLTDHSYFRKDALKNLLLEINEEVLRLYMENDMEGYAITKRRKYTVERTMPEDEQDLDLKGYNCLAVVSSQIFNKDGMLFAYTQSRIRPDQFVFYEQVHKSERSKR